MISSPLNPHEVRILACLMEKQSSTPEYYPLTMSALLHACNQSSNRDPIMNFVESDLPPILEQLKEKGLVWTITPQGARVQKFEQRLSEELSLSLQEQAVLTELMLRGPQTLGELRNRSHRMYVFENLEEVEAALNAMAEANPPLVQRLPRQPGAREARYTHLLSGPPDLESPSLAPRTEGNTRIQQLEESVAELQTQLQALREAFEAFRAQF